MGGGGAGFQLHAVVAQLLKVGGAVLVGLHHGGHPVLGGGGLGGVGHDDLALPALVEKIVPGLGGVRLIHAQEPGDAHGHETAGGVVAVGIDVLFGDVVGLGGDIGRQPAVGLEDLIVGGVAQPDKIAGDLAAVLGLGGHFGDQLAAARVVVFHIHAGILGFKGLLNGLQLRFLHGRVQHDLAAGAVRKRGRGQAQDHHQSQKDRDAFFHDGFLLLKYCRGCCKYYTAALVQCQQKIERETRAF